MNKRLKILENCSKYDIDIFVYDIFIPRLNNQDEDIDTKINLRNIVIERLSKNPNINDKLISIYKRDIDKSLYSF